MKKCEHEWKAIVGISNLPTFDDCPFGCVLNYLFFCNKCKVCYVDSKVSFKHSMEIPIPEPKKKYKNWRYKSSAGDFFGDVLKEKDLK